MLLIKDINYLVGTSKAKLLIIVFLFIFSAMLDLIGLSVIGPYVKFIMGFEKNQNTVFNLHYFLDYKFSYEETVIYAGFFLILIFLIKALFSIILHSKIIKFSLDQQVALRSKLINSYLNIPYFKFIESSTSKFINHAVSLTATFSQSVLMSLIRITSDCMICLIIVLWLLFFQPIALITMFIVSCLFVVSYNKFMKKKINEYGKLSNETGETYIRNVSEATFGIREIKIFGIEKFMYLRTVAAARTYANYQSKYNILATIPRYFLELIFAIFIIILIITLIIAETSKSEMIETIAIFGLAALRLLPAASSITSGLVSIQFGKDSVDKLKEEISWLKDIEFNSLSKNQNLPSEFNYIILKNISFSYNKSGEKILSNINLEIKKGELISIVGTSGSGKSTLIDIILGFLVPQVGKVCIDKESIHNNISWWQHQCAYIPQSSFLIDDTVLNNVFFGSDEENTNQSWAHSCLKMVKLIGNNNNLDLDIFKTIGEGGKNLSGGQKQRLVIARALYRKRKILIFDEPTSALDAETSAEVFELIKSFKNKCTIILVTHDLRIAKLCDRVFTIKNTKLINLR